MEHDNDAPASPAKVQLPAANTSTPKTVLLGAPVKDMHQAMQEKLQGNDAQVVHEYKPAPGANFLPHQVAVAFGRFDKDDPAKITHQRCVPCEPGRIIERGGRKYMIMRDGSQRRIAQEKLRKNKFGSKPK
ncbi:MAG: hypothetical protein WC322_04945 [Candidatus Paceibacterota bacterium]|jgi:hypothetical protein